MDAKSTKGFSQNTLETQLSSNLALLEKSQHSLYQYLYPHVSQFTSSIKVIYLEDEDDYRILLGEECIYQQYYNSQQNEIFPDNKVKLDKIAVTRYPVKSPHSLLAIERFKASKVFRKILDIKSDFIAEHLPCNSTVKDVSRKTPHEYRYLIVLGSGLLSTYFRLRQSKKINIDVDMIFLVEDSPFEFLIFLMFNDLTECVESLRVNKIGLQLTCESDSEAIRLRLIDMLLTKNIFSVYGASIFKSSFISPTLMEVDNWLHAGDGLRQYLYANLGNMSDEINQSLQACWNLSDSAPNNFLKDQVFDIHSVHVLVSSGPSSSYFLPKLFEIKEKVKIVACGSALGELLNAGIVPDYLVVLERNSHVYADFLALSSQYDLSSIHLLACASSDPRLKNLFKRTTFYFRGASACTRLFKESQGSILPICGPNVVNAALEIFLAKKVENLLLLGADFGARIDAAELRAPNATGGRYKRQLNMPVMGNHGRTIFSDNRLLVSREIVEYLLKEYSRTNVYRIGEGALIEGLNELTSIDDLTQLINSNYNSRLSSFSAHIPSDMSTTSISYDRLKAALSKWCSELKSSVNGSSWDLILHRKLNFRCSRYLFIDETSEDGFIRHLMAHPLFVVLMSYYDCQEKGSFDENIDTLESIADYFLQLMSMFKDLSSRPGAEYDKDFLLEALDQL